MLYSSRTKNIFLLLLTLINCFLLAKVKAENIDNNICVNSQLEASYELDDSWIYICKNEQEKIFHQISKNNHQEIVTIPAEGNFPTFAAIEGDLSDSNSKIYNISPYDFKIIQASIIQTIQPVINAIYQPTGVNVTILNGQKEQEAIVICQPKTPVQVYETTTDNIYICIDNDENVNDINLTYVQQSKNNPLNLINLPAILFSNFTYQATNKNQSYLISYKGLEIYENQQKISTQPVIHLYLVTSDATHPDIH
jgi:hypothetical protein